LAGITLISGMLVAGSVALASTPAGLFELDGNATTNHAGSGLPDDWDRVCHEVLGTDCSTTDDTNGATAVSWTADTHGAIGPLAACSGTNCTIFTGGGSKDPQDINQWAWKDNVGGLPDKDNLLHSFAARYSIPSSPTCPGAGGDTTGATTCEMLFFGNDRFDNSGDAQQGFWFFQNKIGLGTNAVGGGNGFTSSGAPEFHRNGDLLLISDFSNGGTTSTITVYKWDTTCLKGVNNPTPGQCGDANLRLLATSAAANCNPVNPAISGFCGIVNATTITMPWSFVDKSGTPNNQALNGEFYEGGVNLSSLGLGGECFASVASETRSSTSTTAVLKDFVLGDFGQCGSSTSTTPKDGTGGTITDHNSNGVPDLSIGTGSVTAKDHADVTVSGVTTWAGNVQFFICGPLAFSPTTTNCATGGDAVGSPVGVSNVSPSADSAVTTFTSVGRYCWRATFTATTPPTGVPSSSDGSTTECFEVLPVTPTLATAAGPDVTLGNPITDTATLTGTANKPGSGGLGTDGSINPTTAGAPAGGTISWTVAGPGGCTASGLTVTGSPATVTGDGSYGPVSATPTVPGLYTFIATYTSDDDNTNSTGPSACPEGTEEVNVTGTSSLSTAQDWLPNDTATLTGSTNLNGTLTFVLYNDGSCGDDGGTAIYSPTATIVTNAPSGTTFSTSNTTVKVLATGNFSWLVTYVDNVLTDPAPSCESTNITITN
jgi:hypothetical protein